MVTGFHCPNVFFSFLSHFGMLIMCKWPRLNLGTGALLVWMEHPALISGTLWALLCYIWTCSCALTLTCHNSRVQNSSNKQELFQEMYTGLLALVCSACFLKKSLRRIISLTNIGGFYLYSCERIFQKPQEMLFLFSSHPSVNFFSVLHLQILM